MDRTADDTDIQRIVAIFRALADPARIRILGAVAAEPRSGSDLSALLGLSPPTISHHVAKLAAAGLIATTPDAQRRIYSLNTETLRALSRSTVRAEAEVQDGTLSEVDRERAKTIRDFFDGERLKQIPAQRRKRVIVLQHLLERFSPDTDYPERSVNELLKRANPDFATLRRELVDYGFMTREQGIYRIAESLPIRGPSVAQEIPGDEQNWLRVLLDGALARSTTAE